MDMSDDSGGMDIDMFQPLNMAYGRAYWYIVAGFVGAVAIVRGVNYVQSRIRLRRCAAGLLSDPTRPTGPFWQAWATLTAIGREVSYPQLRIPWRGASWLTPPPTGRVLILLVYWAVITGFATSGAIYKDAFFWERIGFRNAWVTASQVPLMYLLASKCSVLAWITGTSHERLNWLHRWVGRTIFVTASVHGWHFYTEWVRADFVQAELAAMPMVKYGLGAWGILLWTVLSSLAPLRRWCYEFFVLQHLVAYVVFLYIIYMHVPPYAQYNVWFAIAALCFDRVGRTALLVWQNVQLRPNRSQCRGGRRVGHQAQARAAGQDTTIITIKDVHFPWRAGQHLYLWAPGLAPLEAHPYTIACAHRVEGACICNSIQLVVRKHGSFSERLHRYASRARASSGSSGDGSFRVFVSGPYGAPPRWDIFETLVFISASTGASFTLPILESLLQRCDPDGRGAAAASPRCTRRVTFLLTAKKGDEIGFYVQRLQEAVECARDSDIELNVHIAITGKGVEGGSLLFPSSSSSTGATGSTIGTGCACCSGGGGAGEHVKSSRASSTSSSTDSSSTTDGMVDEKGAAVDLEKAAAGLTLSHGLRTRSGSNPGNPGRPGPRLQHSRTRPDVGSFIREAVEAAFGETSVVVCGGPSLVAGVRNSVAALSDERGVHKGTGAQGIHLHAEEYAF